MDSSSSDKQWDAEITGLLERSAGRWRLTVGEALAGGALGRVFACEDANGKDLVLKFSPPMAGAALEARALLHWDGQGAARLVDWNADDNALLLERVRPGTFLMERDRSRPDDELAVRAAAGALEAMQSVPQPPGGQFPSFQERLRWWLEYNARFGESSAAGTALLPSLERCARALDASAPGRSLLHGDFVAKNLLDAGDGKFVAIDPIPCIGDPCSDIGQFTAYHSPVSTTTFRAREIAARSGHNAERAAQWAAVWMIFQACETWREDSDDVQGWVRGDECAGLLASVR